MFFNIQKIENLLSVAGGFLKGLGKQSDLEISSLPPEAVIYSIRDISDDSADAGNLWIFPRGAPQNLKTLKKLFPESPGNLNFRFLVENEFGKIWIHVKPEDEIPRYRGRIVAQITRLPVTVVDLEIQNSPPTRNLEIPKAAVVKPEKILDTRETYSERTAREQRQQEAKVSAQIALSEILDKWSHEDSGKLRDVRALLSTMQKVLWPESGWDACSLGELMLSEAAVKKCWRKAVILCHPDRHQNSSAEQQYRADRIFGAVNDAFKIFNGANS